MISPLVVVGLLLSSYVQSICLLGLIICIIRMSTLTTKTPELVVARRHRDNRPMPLANSTKINRQLDETLTKITFFALLVYQVGARWRHR